MDKNTIPAELQAIEIPHWVCWLAQDADGCWWGYEIEPLQHASGWYENEIDRTIRLGRGIAAPDWRKNLVRLK